MNWLKAAAILAAAVLYGSLVACGQQADTSPPPRAEEVGETSNGSIEVWDDPQRDVVCYAWDGYETDGFSCVHYPEGQ